MTDRISEREIERIATIAADKAAEQAVHEFGRLLGVDTRDTRSINNARVDLIYLHELRRTSESIKSRAVWVLTGAALLGALSMMTGGLHDWLRARLGL